ncbi:MAG TPA: hypothetical protein VGL26_10190 [Jatrophihabitans sp.]
MTRFQRARRRARRSLSTEPEDVAALSSGQRRWKLLSDLSDALLAWQGDYVAFATAVATSVAQNIGDGGLTGGAHRSARPGRARRRIRTSGSRRIESDTVLFEKLGPEGLRDWVAAFEGREGRLHRSTFEDVPVIE